MEAVGVVLSCAATLAGSFGDNCVKYSYNLVEREGLRTEDWTCCAPQYAYASIIWCTGWTSTIVLNTVLNALSLMWAPASLVIPMSALHIVWNVGFAKLMNEESISWWVLGCTALNIVGILGILVGGPKIDPLYNFPEEVAQLILNPVWIVYKIAILAVLAFIIVQRFFPHVIRMFTGRNSPKSERTAGMLLPGLCASFTFAYFKIMMEMSSTEEGGSPFVQVSFWAVVALVAPFAVCQIWSLNLSLSMYDASKAVPLYASTLIVMGSINGMILFKEYSKIGAFLKWLLFVMGVGIAVASIFLTGLYTTEKGDAEKEAEGEIDMDVLKRSSEDKLRPDCRPVSCEMPEIPIELRGEMKSAEMTPTRSCCGAFSLFGVPALPRQVPTRTRDRPPAHESRAELGGPRGS